MIRLGQTDHKLTQNLNANTFKITGLGDASSSGEALHYGQIGVAIQAYDDELAAIAGLSSAANKIPYFTGSGSAAMLDFNASSAISTSTSKVSSDSVIKSFVEALILGIDQKDPVHAAIDSNIDISTDLVNGASLGGVTVVTGRRYALVGQTDLSENGIYIAVASGAASRSSDADSSAEVTYGMEFAVIAGDYAGQKGTLVTTGAITLDTTDLDFVLTTFGSYTEGDYISLAGNAISIDSAELLAIAGLTSAANKLPMFTGSGTADLIDFLDQDDMSSDSATAVPSQQSVKAYVDNEISAISIPTFVTDEAGDITGSVNGSNAAFVLSSAPAAGSLQLFLNGVLQIAGSGKDYTLSSATVTFETGKQPLTGDELLAFYRV